VPYAYKVNRVTISGTCAGGAEEWSTGFYMGYAAGDSSNPTQTLADSIKTAWQTFFTATASKVQSNYTTRSIKISQLNTDGSTLLDNTIFSDYATPIVGTGASTFFPPQVSLVCTLQSALSRGLAAKGRMYLPGVGAPLASTGKISATADVTAIATNLKTFFDAVNTAGGVAGKIILASKGRPGVAGSASNQLMTKLRVGDVYDTQRRRRNGLVETYQSATLA